MSLTLPYTVHSSPYQNHFIIVQLSVAEPPTFWWVHESDSTLYSSQQSISKSFYYSPIVCCRTPPPFGGSVSLTLPYTLHSSPYQNYFTIVQLSVAETPPPTLWWVRESDSTLYSSTDNCYNHITMLPI